MSMQRSCRRTSSLRSCPPLRVDSTSSTLPTLRLDSVSGDDDLISCRTRVRTRSPPHRNCLAGRHPGGRRSAFGVAGVIAAQPRCPASRERLGPHAGVLHSLLSRTSRRRRGPQTGYLHGPGSAPPEGGVVHRPALTQFPHRTSRERRGPHTDVAMTDFARGVAARTMSPVLRSHPAPSEEVAARIQATTGAIVDSRSQWQLWSELQRFPDSHRTPERGQCPSRRHDRRDSRTRSGSY